MQFSEDDSSLLISTIQNITGLVHDISYARFGETHEKHSVMFMRNLFINLMGNFIFQYSDQTASNAIEENFNQVYKNLNSFKEKALANINKNTKGKH